MKKSFGLSLVLAAALLVGATSANAASIKATGSWQVDAMWMDQWDMNKASQDNGFSIGQRMRTKFEFIANENLKGVLETQIGTQSWGRGMYGIGAGRTPGYNTGSGGSNTANNGNLLFRKGYIDFKWPGTKTEFLVGYQSLALPAAFGLGNAILDDHVAGAAAIVPVTDNFSLVGGYARGIDTNGFGATSSNSRTGTYLDSAFMYANIDFTGYKVQPFLAYSYAGKNAIAAAYSAADGTLTGQAASNLANANIDGSRGYYGGVAFTMTALDPFKVMADFNYGKSTTNGTGRNGNGWDSMGRSGWLFDLAVDYTGLSMMTPELFFAYTSGGNAEKKTDGRMATLSAENWTYGSFFMQSADMGLNSTVAGQTDSDSKRNLGFWALGLSLKDIKLIDKLSHTVHFVYFKGTNDKNMVSAAAITGGSVAYGKTLSTKDSIFEVDLNSKYQIYEELSLGLELGYINANYDKTLWSTATGVNSGDLSKDAYKAAFMLNYSF